MKKTTVILIITFGLLTFLFIALLMYNFFLKVEAKNHDIRKNAMFELLLDDRDSIQALKEENHFLRMKIETLRDSLNAVK